MNFSTLLPPLLASLALSACALVPNAVPQQIYTLAPPPVPAAKTVARVDGLRVLRPQADELLDGRQILVRPEGQSFRYYKGGQWSSAVPELWRNYLVDILRRDARFSRVSSDQVRLQAGYELVSRLQAFQTEYRAGGPVAVIDIYLQLVDAESGRIIAERRLNREQVAAAGDLEAVVEAYGVAAAQLAAGIADWLVAAAGR